MEKRRAALNVYYVESSVDQWTTSPLGHWSPPILESVPKTLDHSSNHIKSFFIWRSCKTCVQHCNSSSSLLAQQQHPPIGASVPQDDFAEWRRQGDLKECRGLRFVTVVTVFEKDLKQKNAPEPSQVPGQSASPTPNSQQVHARPRATIGPMMVPRTYIPLY